MWVLGTRPGRGVRRLWWGDVRAGLTFAVPRSLDWSGLAGTLDGQLVLPPDPGYATARQLFNPRFDQVNPAAISLCRSVGDVQRSIAFARAHEIQLAVRSGGHSYGGYSTGPGLVTDVTGLNGVMVDPAAGTATVGAGTRLIDVYAQLAQAGVSIPAGSCATVGIAGLALGRGHGGVLGLQAADRVREGCGAQPKVTVSGLYLGALERWRRCSARWSPGWAPARRAVPWSGRAPTCTP